jgi:hypothetical protein
MDEVSGQRFLQYNCRGGLEFSGGGVRILATGITATGWGALMGTPAAGEY